MRIFPSPSVILFPDSVLSVIKKSLSISDIFNQIRKTAILFFPCPCSFLNLYMSLSLLPEHCGENQASHLLKILFSSWRTLRGTQRLRIIRSLITSLFHFHAPTQNSEETYSYYSAFSSLKMGSITVKVEPSPGLLFTFISPLDSLMIP